MCGANPFRFESRGQYFKWLNTLEVTGNKSVFKSVFFFLAQALASAIASTKVMKAQQVVKSESGEEVKALFISFIANCNSRFMPSLKVANYIGMWLGQNILMLLVNSQLLEIQRALLWISACFYILYFCEFQTLIYFSDVSMVLYRNKKASWFPCIGL